MSHWGSAFTGIGSGLVFGVALEKGDVHRPLTIWRQMNMQKFTMVKMFLSAAASGAVAIGAMNALGLNSQEHVKPLFPLANVLGGLLLGAGMTVTGACPGTVFAQLGSGVGTAPYVLAGGAVGAMLYAYADPYVVNSVLYSVAANPSVAS